MPFSERLYRLALRAYPRAFRRRYGDEMAGWFRMRMHERGPGALPGIVLDLLRSVPREHLRAWRAGSTGSVDGPAPRGVEVTSGKGGGWMSELWQDLRITARTFARRPGFPAVATITIATGIAAVTTIFSIVDAVLLTPLPYPDPDRIVRVGQTNEARDRLYSMSYLDFRDLQAGTESFEALAATRVGSFAVMGEAGPDVVPGAYVAAEFFAALGVEPIHGRAFTAAEDRGEQRLAVVSDAFWRARWGADPDLVGGRITLGGEPWTVVGIMPPDFIPPEGLGMSGTAVWVPLALVDPVARDSRSDGFLVGVGRLAPGVEPAAARAELDVLGAGLRAAWPEESGDKSWTFRSLHEQTVGTAGSRLAPVLGAVAFLLLIACVNVANLMLVRASERGREFAVRTAMGANRGRLVRQLFTESALVGGCGAAAGIALAALGVPAFVASNPGDLPRLVEVDLDGSVLLFTALISVVATIGFGLAPALMTMRGDLAGGLRDGGRAGSSSAQERLRGGLVVLETGLALVLVVGAGLLAGSFVRMNQVDLGYEPDGVHVMRITWPDGDDPAATAGFFETLVERLEALPGVRAAGATAVLPASGGSMYQRLYFEPGASEEDGYPVKYQQVTDDYFDVVGMTVTRGRVFGPDDALGGAPVAIVSERMARERFGDDDPLGRSFELREGGVLPGSYEIVGVVEDARVRGIRDDVEPELYLSARQVPRTSMDVVVRADRGSTGMLDRMRDEVWAIRSDLPVRRRTLLTTYVAGSIAPERFYALLLTGFASVAMLLALVGIYGTLSYTVSQRVREVGIRMAIGASAGSVLRLVVRRGVMLSALGVGLGIAAAIPLTSLLEAFVFGVSATDPVTIAGAALLMLLTAALASLVPARRATRLDPTEVLRGD